MSRNAGKSGSVFEGIFGSKPETASLVSFLSEVCKVLDPQNMEIIIARCGESEVLFTNDRAGRRMLSGDDSDLSCKTGFASFYRELCKNCPFGEKTGETANEPSEIEDLDGRKYSVRSNIIRWTDGKPAAIIALRDMTSEDEAMKRLYNLAYIDQLTCVPNRQKLKEDFSAIEEDIDAGRVTGIVSIFDLDNFKNVNDTYGHNTGDVVLRRLTEHIQEDKAFEGHLYRLGGDEFVLLYSNPGDRFATEGDMEKHYTELLSAALLAYTLPNIEVKCTLSMGVSSFPKHGSSLSDILRKADIALYKAKLGGRNRIVFFEDQYDAAQKFKDIYINMQPILLSMGKTFGYELIDRWSGSEEDDKTVTLSELNHTLDALGLNDLENKSVYFITYSKHLLNPAVIRNLPKEKFIIQINTPDGYIAQSLQHEIQKCDELKKNGYLLALTGLDSEAPVTELLNLADYCKFRISDLDLQRQKKVIASNRRVKFIATGVDTPKAFREAKEAGFHLFQGFYFNQPVVDQNTKEINPLKINYLRLLKLSSIDDYMDFREISSIISSDVALSYKLLRILNSAAVGLNNVTSIASAVAYLGEESLKKWIAVLALRGIAEDKPLELVRMSLIRARFGELLAQNYRTKPDPKKVFMVSMLSLLHIALDKSREQMLTEIPVAAEIRDSLLTKTGIYSELLRFYECYEYANWEAVSQFVEDNGMEPTFVNDAYIASVKWYNDLADF